MTQYLDENGNPQAATPQAAPQPSAAPRYLDDNGNPMQSGPTALEKSNAAVDQMQKDHPEMAKNLGFGGGVMDTLSNVASGVGTGLKSLYGFATGLAKDISDPNKPLFWSEKGAAPGSQGESTLYKYGFAPQVEQFNKANESVRLHNEAVRNGDANAAMRHKAEAWGHFGASILPFIGPWVASHAEHFGQTGDLVNEASQFATEYVAGRAAEGGLEKAVGGTTRLAGKVAESGALKMGASPEVAATVGNIASIGSLGADLGEHIEALDKAVDTHIQSMSDFDAANKAAEAAQARVDADPKDVNAQAGLKAAQKDLVKAGAVRDASEAAVNKIQDNITKNLTPLDWSKLSLENIGNIVDKAINSKPVDLAKAAIGKTADFETAVTRFANMASKAAGLRFREALSGVADDMKSIFNNDIENKIVDPNSAADAVQQHIQQNIEKPLQEKSGATRDEAKPVVDNFRARAEERINKFFDENPGKFGSAEEEEATKQRLLDRLERPQNIGNGVTGVRDPNLFEAENIRQGLNQYDPNSSNGFRAAAYDLANFMREVIDEGYDQRGVSGVKEARAKEAKLIDVAKGLRTAQTLFEAQQAVPTLKKIWGSTKAAGTVATLGSLLLHSPWGALSGAAELWGDIYASNIRNSGGNLARAKELAGREPGATATTPETNPQAPSAQAPPSAGPQGGQGPAPVRLNTPPPPKPPNPVAPPAINHRLNGALSSFLGVDIGKVPYDDMMKKYQEHAQKLRDSIDSGAGPDTPVTGPDGIKRTLGEQLQITSKMRGTLNTERALENERIEKENAANQQKYQKEYQKWQQKVGEQQAKAQEEAAQQVQAEKAKREADEQARIASLLADERIAHSPVMKAIDPAMEIGGTEGRTSAENHLHEHGHIMANVAEGLNPINFVSEFHPDAAEEGAAAQVHTDVSGAEEGNKGIAQRVVGILGGPAFDEVHQNIKLGHNTGARADIARARQILREEGGLSGNQLEKVFDALYDRAKEHVANPEALALVEANAPLRESGLHKNFHMSPGRLEEYVNKLKGAYRNGETPSTEGVREGDSDERVQSGEPTDAGSKGGEQDRAVEGVRSEAARESDKGAAKPEEKSSLDLEKARESVRKERTTGDENIDKTIREAGGVPSGSAKNFPFRNAEGNFEDKNAAYITEPKYGSTGIIPFDEVTPERIKSEMERMRAAWEGKTEQSNLTRRAGVGGVSGDETRPEESYFAQQARGENYRARGARANPDADMGNGGKAWLSTKGEYDPQDRIHSDYDKNFAKSNVRIGNLEGDGKLLVHSQGPLNEAQRTAVAADIRKQGGAIYDFEGSTDSPGGGLRGEATTVGDFMRAHDKAYPEKAVDNLKGVEMSALTKTKAQSVADKIKEKYGTTDSVEPLRREHSFIHPDGSLTHLEGTQHGDAIAEAGGGRSNERNNWDNRPEFVNKSGVVRAHGFQNRAGDNLSFSVPKDGVTPEQLETMRRAAAQGFLRNGTLNIERADVGANTKDQLSKQKSFPRGGDVDQMLRDIGAHPSQKVEQSNLSKNEAQMKSAQEDYNKERDFAGDILKGDKKVEDFPYFDSYKKTIDNEAKLLPKGGKVLFIGSGPVPASSILFDRAGFHTDSLELDPETAKIGENVARKSGMQNGKFMSGDARDLTPEQLKDYDGVVVALEAGPEDASKNQVLNQVMQNIKPGTKVLARGTAGTGGDEFVDVQKNLPAGVRSKGSVDTFDGYGKTHVLEKGGDWADSAAQQAAKQGGGFSIDPKTGKAPSSGYMVELFPERRATLDHPATAEDIRNFAEKNKDILATHPELHVGGYNNELNIAGRFGDLHEATRAAKNLDQISAWDVAKGEEVPMGGNNRGGYFPDYKVQDRLSDLENSHADMGGKWAGLGGAEEHPEYEDLEHLIQPAKNEAPVNTPQVEKSNLTASPEWKKKIKETPWETDDHPSNSFATGYRQLIVKDARGNEVGALKYSGDDGDLYSRIRTSRLDPDYQNQGIAKEMYKSGIEDARNRGIKEFRSDTSVSDAARHVWEALAREGYPVYREYTNKMNANGQGGVEYTIPLQGQKITDADFEPLNTTVEQSNLVKGSSVPLMNKPIDVKPGEGRDVPNTLDVTKALNQYSRKQLPALKPGSEPEKMTDRAKRIAEDEAKYQLAQSKTGTEWYTTEMKDHDNEITQMRPELLTGPETTGDAPWAHTAKMTLFKAAEAVLSSGQRPYANVKSALRAWDFYHETGEFPPTNPETGKSWGPRGVAAYGNAFDYLNRLIKEKGEKGAADWLLGEHPISELRQYNKDVPGKMTDTNTGAMILGQKRGPFMQNLHGIESKFTADMWVSRSWNRWMGTLDLDPRIDDKGKVSSQSDAPRNNTERQLMKESFAHTAEKLGLTTSSLQAVLWYYEQALYRAHGLPVESWSFSDAAKRVSKEQNAAEPQQDAFDFGHNEKPAESQKALGFMSWNTVPKVDATGRPYGRPDLNK